VSTPFLGKPAIEALGIRLRDLRRDVGLTGRRLASACHWQPSKVSKIEYGRQTPTETDIRDWCLACGFPSEIPDLITAVRSIHAQFVECAALSKAAQGYVNAPTWTPTRRPPCFGSGNQLALRLSHAAEDRLFGGRVLAAMSHQALHLGQAQFAVDLARAAHIGTARVAPPRAVAMLAAMEAMAQAASGASADCTAALVAAERALGRASADDDNPDWLDFDEGGLWGHAARAYRYLRRGHDCARYAQSAITHCRRTHGRTRAQRAAILATAHVQLGQLDQAAALRSQIVDDAWNLHSRHVYEEVAALTHALDGRRTTGSRDFLDQSREYLVARRTL
jgi:transcriptional regulator with XRE-family HTH domain